MSRLHVRAADGSLVSGAAAFAAIWSRVPGYRWLAAAAARPPLLRLMELAYSGFLRLRPLWRRTEPAVSDSGRAIEGSARILPLPVATRALAPAAKPALPSNVLADLRADHAGEAGAAQMYRGVLAMAAGDGLRAFAARRLATALLHQQRIGRWLPAASRSHLLPLWRAAGWAAGALPALIGPRVVFATVAAVERLLDRRYGRQVERLAASPQFAELRATLAACRVDGTGQRRGAPARLHGLPDPLVGAGGAGRRGLLAGGRGRLAVVASGPVPRPARGSFERRREAVR
jgi:demethoxyubiquinone hydroxylase (CLK1/Coq7/Cat5 family)